MKYLQSAEYKILQAGQPSSRIKAIYKKYINVQIHTQNTILYVPDI